MSEYILGISAFYHDSAAVLLKDGIVVAAAQEERFTRKKHDSSFPNNSIQYVMGEYGLSIDDITIVAFYDKPWIKFERLLETYHNFAPAGLLSFLTAIPVWVKNKIFLKTHIQKELGSKKIKIFFPEHHLSHAASAFFPSPFNESAVLTIDGVGEWATTTVSYGSENSITVLNQIDFPHSLGLLYSAFTYYCGFRVNSGEYKLMGLAPYGNENSEEYTDFIKTIKQEIVDIRPDGSFLLNMKYFDYATGLRMCNEKKWQKIFRVPKRDQNDELTQSYMNLALAIQHVTEEIVFKLAETAKHQTGSTNLVLAGGVALNCVANGKLLKRNIFDNIWVQPAAGDAGGALGAALSAWYIGLNNTRTLDGHKFDSMNFTYLGPEYSDLDITKTANKYDAVYTKYDSFHDLCETTAHYIKDGFVVGWYQGKMEYGPRALGNRSILADPFNKETQKFLNLRIKYREGFRPFAPSVLLEDAAEYFDLPGEHPYMLFTAPVTEGIRNKVPDNYANWSMMDKLYFIRSTLPAVTHIDYSARVQTVSKNSNFKYWTLLHKLKELTGHGIVVNTSFNVRGEPIVNTPEDAFMCFMNTEMNYLVMNNFIFKKHDQSNVLKAKLKDRKIVFAPD